MYWICLYWIQSNYYIVLGTDDELESLAEKREELGGK